MTIWFVLAAIALAAMVVFRLPGRLFALLFMRRGLVIGPWVMGRNHSKGLPLRPKRVGKGWTVKVDGGELHAVQDFGFRIPADAKALLWHYRFEGEAFPAEYPDRLPLVSIVLQRKGDDWTGDGKAQHYRLFSPAFHLVSGEYTRELPLEGWTGVWGNPGDVRAVLNDLSNVAVAFGHSSGRMHGVRGNFVFEQIALVPRQ